MTDFFISRNSADREWAQWIAGELEEAGYSTVIQDWDFQAGANFVLEMHKASKECERTMIVLSQNFLEAEYTQPEWAAALAGDPQGKKRKLVPVRVRECQPDGLLAAISYVDLVGQNDEGEAREILLQGVREGRAKRKGRFPGAAKAKSAFPGTPVFHVPLARNGFFTGRGEVLKELHRRLRSEGGAALSQVEAISGLGGIGKTQTALEYAYRHRDEYQAVLWARAESEESLISAFAEIADVLELKGKDAQEQAQAVAAFKRWLGERSDWLLILDNADRPELVKGFLPTDHKGSVLVTSRAGVFDSLGIAQPLRMRKMPPDEANRFLCERTGRPEAEGQEAEAVRDLAEELGYLPLALEQAAAYIIKVGCTFQTYLESYRTRGVELLELQGPVAGDYPESIRTTWSMNIEQVAQQSEASVEVLKLSAFLAPDAIPLVLLAKGANEIGPVFSAQVSEQDRLSIEEVLQPLSQFSLVQREPGSDSYSVHSMVQAVVQASLCAEERKQWANRTVLAVHRAFPIPDFPNWALCESLTSHVQRCSEMVQSFGLQTPEAGQLLSRLGEYLRRRSTYSTARLALERALAIQEKALGSEHPAVATILSNLASVYVELGKPSEALPLYERSIVIYEKGFGPDDPHVASSLSNLAALCQSQAESGRALTLCMRALAIRVKSLGSEHPDVASSLNNLASIYNSQGDYRRAMPLYERALAIWEKLLGPEHPRVANGLNNLSDLHRAQGDYSRAMPLCKRALAIRENALGPEHPDVAISLNNLAELYRNQNDDSRALPLYERALAILGNSLGSEHPRVGTCLNNMASLYESQGDFRQAFIFYKRALAIREKSLGSEHPDVAASLNNLALLYRSQGARIRAVSLCKRSISILEKVLPGHPHLATGIENCAVILEELGRLDEAQELKARAKRILDEHARRNPKTGE